MDIDLDTRYQQSDMDENNITEIRRKTKITFTFTNLLDKKIERRRTIRTNMETIGEHRRETNPRGPWPPEAREHSVEFYWGYCTHIEKELENDINWIVVSTYSDNSKYHSICRQFVEGDVTTIESLFEDMDCNIRDMLIVSCIILFLSNKTNRINDNNEMTSLIVGLFHFEIGGRSNKIFMEISQRDKSWLIYVRQDNERQVAILRKGIVIDETEDVPTIKSSKIK